MASASATASRDRLVAELEAIARAATQGRAPELSGVYVTPSNLSRLDGILCLQASFYKGAIFRFTLELPPTYPRAPPTVRFVANSVRHPLVAADGTLRLVGEHLDPWEPAALGAAPLVQVLAHAKRAFFRREYCSDPSMHAAARRASPSRGGRRPRRRRAGARRRARGGGAAIARVGGGARLAPLRRRPGRLEQPSDAALLV